MPLHKVISALVLVILIPILYRLLTPYPVYAVSCGFYGDNIDVPVGSTLTASLTVTNLDPENAIAVKFTNEGGSEIFKITGGSAPGWSANLDGENINFTGGSLGASQEATFSVQIQGLVVKESYAQGINANVSADGSAMEECAGGRNVSVIGSPIPQNLAVSVTSTTATVVWLTALEANSLMNYGTSVSYGSSASNASFVTSHNLALTGLIPSATYYYQICSTSQTGNQACSGQNNFTTSAVAATSAPTAAPTVVTTTTTTSATVAPVPTAAPVVVEKTPPVVLLTTEFDEPFTEAPKIEGKASDNKDLAAIEYSTDGGVNWLPVDNIEDAEARATNFDFTPFLTEDGNYEIVARAKDSAGNIGNSSAKTLVIDRLPPRVGGNIIALGPHLLTPNEDGVIITLAGLETRITVSSVGGVTMMDILSNEKMYSLARSPDTGLWAGTLNFPDPGLYQLTVRAEDGAGNKTERELNRVLVLPPGRFTDRETGQSIQEGTITLFYKDSLTAQWTVWDAASFSQENPQKLDENGNYQLYLPSGTYYIEVRAPGYTRFVSKIFAVSESTPLNTDLALKPGRKITIGPFSFTIPDLFGAEEEISIKVPDFSDLGGNPLVGNEAPIFTLNSTADESFDLTSLRGSSSVLTFINTWSPQSIEQVSAMEKLIADRQINGTLVSTQESLPKVTLFLARGGYNVPVVTDPDGTLVEDYNLTSLPTHFFLNRRGIVDKVVSGVLNEDEIKDLLSQ